MPQNPYLDSPLTGRTTDGALRRPTLFVQPAGYLCNKSQRCEMPQLVGLPCIHCQDRIWDELEGRFCPDCGSPVHRRCAHEKLETGAAVGCSTCGASIESVQTQAQQ